jgi:hypothetical protein
VLDIPQYFPLNSTLCKQGLEFRRWTSDKPGKMGIVSFSQPWALILGFSRRHITKGTFFSKLLALLMSVLLKNIPARIFIIKKATEKDNSLIFFILSRTRPAFVSQLSFGFT